MKRVLKVLAIVGCVLVGFIIIFLIYSFINNYKILNKPRYKDNYYEAFTTNAALESKYSKKENYEVSKIVSKSDNKSIKNIRIWYPTELKDSQNVCPLIIVVNGSQCPAKVYEPFFAKLASWGFIVAGNDDPQPGTGASDDMGVADINKEYGGVAPLASLVDIYNHMSPDVLKVRGRVTGAEHEDMLLETESYMTAWMLYQLKNDIDAQKIFIGNDAEILTNNNWQDVEKNQ